MAETIKHMEEHMMKKNLWLLGGLVAIAFSACTNEDVLPNDNTLASGKKVQVTAYAPGDGAESRIAFNEDEDAGAISLAWENEEGFSVIRGGENQTFSKDSEGNTFEGVLPTQGTGTYYAVYPANTNATDCTAVPYDLSSQTGVLDDSNLYMYATSTDGAEFHFQHTSALLKATFNNTGWTADTKIKEVKVLLPINKAKGTIDLTDVNGTLTGADGYNLITINYATPVDATTASYICLPPMAKDNKTLVFMITTGNEKTYTAILAGDNNKDIEAGKVYTANVTLSEMNYLMFIADGDGQSLGISEDENVEMVTGLEYSTDGITWEDWLDTTQPVNFVNKMLFLRGKTNNGTHGASIIFGNSVKVACLGDIRTLVDYDSYSTIQNSGKFSFLFLHCTSLTTAPKLPAKTLEESCYRGMFQYCSSLTIAPELPAETLANSCYTNMFYVCTSLATAPALQATTLAEDCYSGMFADCTSLTAAPELPAGTLENNCYLRMFENCSSLTSVPELSAETLAEFCYHGMFSGCTSLTIAPALPATSLAESCYSDMFYGCTSLSTAPALPAETLAGYCYGNMFYGCTSLTTAPTFPATTLAQGCYYAMFSGCTSLTNAPALPITSLVEGCYAYMFSYCTSLTTAPTLPATTLVEGCYSYMFSGCTNLENVTMLATDISADYCLENWLEDVATSGTFTKAASLVQGTESGNIPTGVSGIPSGWTVND